MKRKFDTSNRAFTTTQDADAWKLHNLRGDRKIQVSNLCGIRIGDKGAAELAEDLRTNTNNITFQTIDLQDNKIGDDGATALAEALRTNTTLQTIDLSWNRIKYVGAAALAEAL
jgi:Ran GTPase-activating protein (RanGAP) involved in mRNA processing and transport